MVHCLLVPIPPSVMQVHGFPKVMGVLTHLDMFRSQKTLRKTKKRLKNRFWTEIYQVYMSHRCVVTTHTEATLFST